MYVSFLKLHAVVVSSYPENQEVFKYFYNKFFTDGKKVVYPKDHYKIKTLISA